MKRRHLPAWIFAAAVGTGFLTLAKPVLAIQTHGPPEGLYAHQIAHVAFLIAMIYIWLKTRSREGAGWGMIRLSFIFFALWNVNTILVHAIQVYLSPEQFVGTTGMLARYFVPRSGLELYYYFGKMDHLLCVPAALFLGLGLKKLDRSEQTASHAS